MTTATITREQLNEAINKFANKIMDALGAAVTDEAETEPELADTYFKVIDTDDEELVVDAANIPCGTLVTRGVIEYFRYSLGEQDSSCSWMCYNGRRLTPEEFAAEMRAASRTPRIAHWG